MSPAKHVPEVPEAQNCAAASEAWHRQCEDLRSQYAEEVHNYCLMYLGETDAAQHASQEVFCKLLGQYDSQIKNVRAWLYTAARNYCLNQLRLCSRRTKALDVRAQLQMRTVDSPSVLNEVVRSEVHRRLLEIIDLLPIELRVPLYLRYFAGFKRKEIVELLGVPEQRVKARLHQGLKQLRAHSSLRLT